MGGGDGGAADTGMMGGGNANAGIISISGRPGTRSILLMPDMRGNYRPTNVMGAIWAPGETITYTATGGAVPMFMTTLTFPTPITVTRPMPMSILNPVMVSRAMGIDTAWMPGAGNVTVMLGQGGIAGVQSFTNGVLVECVYPSSAGMGRVPPAALSDLTDQTGVIPDAFIAVLARASNDVVAGEWIVTVNATGGGMLAGASVGP